MEKSHEQNLPFHTMLSTLKQLHTQENDWDVQIQVETKIFKSQRTLLIAYSHFFDGMFRSGCRESSKTRDQPILLHYLKATAFEEFYHFMYTSNVRVNDSNILQLLNLNDYLQLRTDYFKGQCIWYVKQRSHENCEPMYDTLDLLDFAYRNKNEEKAFVDILHSYICQHLYHFSKGERLMEFSFENLNTLLEFGKSVILPLSGCADVLMNISFRWVKNNPEERTRYLRKLIKSFSLTHLSSGFGVKPYCTLMEIRFPPDTPMEIDPAVDDAPIIYSYNAILSFDIPNVKEMQIGHRVSSSSYTIISNLKWRIGVKRNNVGLRPYLSCGGTDLSSEWSCRASAIFTVTSRKKRIKDFVTELKFCKFSYARDGKNPIWLAKSILKWEALINPKKEYIKEDGSVSLKAEVYADVPFRKIYDVK